jgi:pyruvate dehydrogenase E2 component (dihydrolipoamide acetyltransferase)
MVFEIRLPPLGQTTDEMSIVEWYKKEGDTIEIAEPLLCVETDKAQVDVESYEEGTVLKIIAQPGELLSSGSLLAYVGAPGEEIPSEPGAAPTKGAAPAAPTAPAAAAAPAAAPAAPPPAAPAPAAGGRIQVSPVVRKLAADLGVDLATVTGTGAGGVITREDVQGAAGGGAASAAAAPAAAAPAGDGELVAVAPLRRAIARRLLKSTQNIPVFRLTAHLDASAAKKEIEAYTAAHGKGLTYTHLLLRAVARALRDHPVMMRLWVEDGPKYQVLTDPNVGLAVAGDDSLYVVTIPTPDTATLADLVEAVKGAAERGRAGQLSKADQSPASITISNLGMFAVDSFDAIIDPDQNAILATASVQDRVVAVDGVPTVVPQLTVNLSCDHRSVDGAQGAQFLRSLRGYFETDPAGPAA